MPTMFDADIILDIAFLGASAILFYYAYATMKYMRTTNYRPKVIERVTWVGIVGIFAAILEISGDLLKQQALVAAHAFGMTLMSTILIFAVRDHQQLLKNANAAQKSRTELRKQVEVHHLQLLKTANESPGTLKRCLVE